MESTLDKGPAWAKWEYFDILWKINDKNADKKMFDYAKKQADAGQKEIQGRLARCYREGRGTEKDLDKAAEWMKKAADQDVPWAKLELFDILWMMNDPTRDIEMFSLVDNQQSKDPQLLERMSNCLRFGRGTEKDLDKAVLLIEEINNLWYGM